MSKFIGGPSDGDTISPDLLTPSNTIKVPLGDGDARAYAIYKIQPNNDAHYHHLERNGKRTPDHRWEEV